MKKQLDIYGGKSPWEVPAYTLPVAARAVRIPVATLRSWVVGRPYGLGPGARRSKPLIVVPKAATRFLSFTNLVEAHVLAAIRRTHEVPMHNVRSALHYLEKELEATHPLAREAFSTDGVDLFVHRVGKLINASKKGQTEMEGAIRAGLQRVEYKLGEARRLFPLVRNDGDDQPKFIVIDPMVAFGRPVIVGTGVPVDEVWQRFKAGESFDVLAEEFRVDPAMVQEAIRASQAAA